MTRFLKFDWVLFFSVVFLLGLGMLALYSISFTDAVFNATNFKKQAASIAIGGAGMFFLSFYDYRVLSSLSTRLYFGVIGILTLVIFFGTTVRGTTGWIGFGAFNIQPVELAKVVMVIFLAGFLSKKRTQLSIAVRIVASIVLVLIPIFLILKQPDFGSGAVIVASWAVMLTVCGLSKKNLLALLLLVAVVFSSGWFFLKDYQKNRIMNVVNPYSDPKGSGYNVIQSMVAVGSGRLWGKGLGHGSQSQLNFLPEKHTDFIFAVIAEELGFLGVSVVFLLFGVIFYRMKEIARNSRDNFGYLLAVGMMAVIFWQFLVNIGMNIGVMPVTGVPLPFVSYGGSSLVAMLLGIGIIQSVYLRGVKNS